MTYKNRKPLDELLSEESPGLAAERFILEATELVLETMEKRQVTQSDLAKLLGKTKGHVSQLLSGKRNMTLRTLAEIMYVLNFRLELKAKSHKGT